MIWWWFDSVNPLTLRSIRLTFAVAQSYGDSDERGDNSESLSYPEFLEVRSCRIGCLTL
jgi:hypothetical protein